MRWDVQGIGLALQRQVGLQFLQVAPVGPDGIVGDAALDSQIGQVLVDQVLDAPRLRRRLVIHARFRSSWFVAPSPQPSPARGEGANLSGLS